jgi:hypothetical protein
VLGCWLRRRRALLKGVGDRLMLMVETGEGCRCDRLLVVKQWARLRERRGMLRCERRGWRRGGRGCRL